MNDQVENGQAQEQEEVQLSLNDIATFVQIVDIASRRGAFEGRELQGVGGLRNKVEAFLNQQAQMQGQQAQAKWHQLTSLPTRHWRIRLLKKSTNLKQTKDGASAPFPTRKCITCGKQFRVVIDHPSVVHCSLKCAK